MVRKITFGKASAHAKRSSRTRIRRANTHPRMTTNNAEGFTLIEMLLVIAVMAVIASLGIIAYRDHLQSERIDRASLNIQNVLQGAMSYNVSNGGDWPPANAQLPNCDVTVGGRAENFVKNYLPNGSYQSDYGNHLCWSQLNNDGHLFWVALEVPGNDKNIAKRIAAKLPNAVTTSDPTSTNDPAPACDSSVCYVRAEVTVPGQADKGSLVGAGACKPLELNNSNPVTDGSEPGLSCKYDGPVGPNAGQPIKYTVTFSCPSGTIPGIVSMPNYLRVGLGEHGQVIYNLRTEKSDCRLNGNSATCPLSIIADRDNGENVTHGYGQGKGWVGADYIAYCHSIGD